MPTNLDSSIYIYIGVILVLGVIAMLMKNKKFIIFKIAVRFILGGAFIYLFNFIGGFIGITIPLNPLTALTTGLLEIPGFALILIVKYAIYPM